MSTVAEIAQVIPTLTNEELRAVEKLVLQTYRERKVGIIFDDAYGTLTEGDLAAIQEDALRIIDGSRLGHEPSAAGRGLVGGLRYGRKGAARARYQRSVRQR